MSLLRENLQRLCPEDVYLSSFPRSGNTWFRKMLIDYSACLEAAKSSQIQSDLLPRGNLVPDIYQHDIRETKAFHASTGAMRIIKTHEPLLMKSDSTDQKRRTIYLVRHPADCLISYFHFRKTLRKNIKASLNEFLSECSTQWLENVSYHLEFAKHNPSRIHFTTYEKSLLAPRQTLKEMLEFLGITINQEALDNTVARNTFEQVSEQKKKSPESMKKFFRQGQSGTGYRELSPAEREKIGVELWPLYVKCCHLENTKN